MLVRIRKWGNSLALRIPAAFARETGIAPGAEVDLSLDGGRLVVTPLPRPAYSLDSLLAGMSDENTHAEVDLGPSRGGEVW